MLKIILVSILFVGSAAHACDKQMQKVLTTQAEKACGGPVSQLSFVTVLKSSIPGFTAAADSQNSKGFISTYSCTGSNQHWISLSSWTYSGDYYFDLKRNAIDGEKCSFELGLDSISREVAL